MSLALLFSCIIPIHVTWYIQGLCAGGAEDAKMSKAVLLSDHYRGGRLTHREQNILGSVRKGI